MTALTENAKPWVLYLLECANGAYYAGITNNLAGRLAAHARGRGAKYTRANPPVRLLGSRSYPDRSQASKAEWKIKQLPRLAKLACLPHARGGVSPPSPRSLSLNSSSPRPWGCFYQHRGRIELRPENPAYSPIVFQEGRELLVWGVVIGVVRRYAARG